MKYLFFDIECASVRGGSKMCSFGYVLADENLNIIESDDIIMNPKCVWDLYALNHILAHPKEYYESFPSFDEQYDRIKNLFAEDTIALGHGVTNDVRFINDDCKRYKLPYIDFVFYDGADIYKEFENAKYQKSLSKVSEQLSSHKQGDKHESKEDAILVYEYMKEICKQMEASIEELLPIVKKCRGENKNGNWVYHSNRQSKQKKPKDRGKLYEYFAMYAVPNEERCNLFLKDKKVAISSHYEKGRLKEMLYIIQLIVNHGGKYTFKGEDADLFVKYQVDELGMIEWCPREEKVDEAIEKGKKIRKVNLNEFLYALGYDENKIEDNYLNAVERVKKIIKKEEIKKEKKKQAKAKTL